MVCPAAKREASSMLALTAVVVVQLSAGISEGGFFRGALGSW